MTGRLGPSHDLIVLTADSQQAAGMEVLLTRRAADLGIPPVTAEVRRHPRHDPGVYGESAEFLRPFLRSHRYALVLVDAAWEGAPPADEIESRIARDLRRNGWAERSAVVVIDPELEVWCWAEGVSAVEEVTGLAWRALRQLGTARGFWKQGDAKPSAPKELFEAALRKSRTPRSARLYASLAESLPLSDCRDPAFGAMCDALSGWFATQA